MNILMMTNTFTPHVGGVARSVQRFTTEYRRRGHRTLVVAPEFEDMPEEETDVFRMPAIQNFNGSDFSVVLPTPGGLTSALEVFQPHIVHSHHPFLIGSTALRVAHVHNLPLVFTHHTMYEQYTHYVPGNSPALKRFVIGLSTSYANLCDQVFAPSESVADVLRERGVEAPMAVVPTGVQLESFARGSGPGFRLAMGIPEDAFLVGHLGRLAPEKNLPFLADAVMAFLKREPRAHFLLVGAGPSQSAVRESFQHNHLCDRLHTVGVLKETLLSSAYQSMDVFAFASKSETQGMVLTEAMAAGVPVVALDAPGVREVVNDSNGRLLKNDSVEEFASALRSMTILSGRQMQELRRASHATAADFSLERLAERSLRLYERLVGQDFVHPDHAFNAWTSAMRRIEAEWELVKGMASAAEAALVNKKHKDEE
jgi:glycosyltransferase involved in cell wall biosynthesis